MEKINIFSGDFCFAFDPEVRDFIKDIFARCAPGRPYLLGSDLDTYISVQYRDLSIEEAVGIANHFFGSSYLLTGYTNRIVFDQQKRTPLLVDSETRQPIEDHETKEN